jgi:hypothetical protein
MIRSLRSGCSKINSSDFLRVDSPKNVVPLAFSRSAGRVRPRRAAERQHSSCEKPRLLLCLIEFAPRVNRRNGTATADGKLGGYFIMAYELRALVTLVSMGMIGWSGCDLGALQIGERQRSPSPGASKDGASGAAGSGASGSHADGRSPEDACAQGSCVVDSSAPDQGVETDGASPGSCALPLPGVQNPQCGVDKCGNGTVDTCELMCPQGPCSSGEQCDGTVPLGTSCETLGYSGGKLSCSAWCAFDERGCTNCAPLGGPLLACQRPCIESANAFRLALAATDHGVGVAWAAERLHFAAFDENLQRRFEWAPSTGSAAWQVAVAPSSSGWIVLAQYETEMTLYALDARGSAVGVQTLPQGRGGALAALGTRPGGPPLLVWNAPSSSTSETGVAQAVLLGEDARLATSPVVLWPSPMQPANILFVGDGFVVAQRTGTAIDTAHVPLSGAAPTVHSSPLGEGTGSPRLFPFRAQVGVIYLNSAVPTGTVDWAVLDTTGKLVNPGIPLAPQPPNYNNRFSVVANDAGALMLAASFQPYLLSLFGFDAQGRVSPTPYIIAKSGKGFDQPLIVRMGAKAVAAWIAGAPLTDINAVSTVELAVVSPNLP